MIRNKPSLLSLKGQSPPLLVVKDLSPLTPGGHGLLEQLQTDTPDHHDLILKKGENSHEKNIHNVVYEQASKQGYANYFTQPYHSSKEGFFATVREPGGKLNYYFDFFKKNSGTMPYLVFIFTQIMRLTQALTFLHETQFLDQENNIHAGILHTDLKTDNIFLNQDGLFVIGDFGSAHYRHESVHDLYLRNIQPELLKNSCPSANQIILEKEAMQTHQHDMYGLGLILGALLNEAHPLDAYADENISLQERAEKFILNNDRPAKQPANKHESLAIHECDPNELFLLLKDIYYELIYPNRPSAKTLLQELNSLSKIFQTSDEDKKMFRDNLIKQFENKKHSLSEFFMQCSISSENGYVAVHSSEKKLQTKTL